MREGNDTGCNMHDGYWFGLDLGRRYPVHLYWHDKTLEKE